jgi:hypothetical protein
VLVCADLLATTVILAGDGNIPSGITVIFHGFTVTSQLVNRGFTAVAHKSTICELQQYERMCGLLATMVVLKEDWGFPGEPPSEGNEARRNGR